jgi:SOS response regulatory protein OraA/RecX
MKVLKRTENKNGFTLFMEDGGEITISAELYFKETVYEKDELTPEEIRGLLFRQEVRDARIICKRYLVGGLKPKRRLLLYLEKRGVDGAAATEALDQLEKEKYLDDKRYALKRIKRKMGTSPVAAEHLKAWLIDKGIEKEAAQSAVEEYGIDDVETAELLIEKKYKSGERDPSKIAAYLSRKGFSTDIIVDLLGKEVLWNG